MTLLTVLPAAELGDLAFRIVESEGPNAWMVAVADADVPEVSEALRREVAELGGGAVAVASATSPAALEAVIREHDDGVVVVCGGDSFSDDDWKRTDLGRSRLGRRGTTVLVLGERALGRLESTAPNLGSWIGGSIWRIRPPAPLDDPAAEQRLIALRAWAGFDDAELIRRAESGYLSTDPPFAEWLTLLGRGDLLVK